MFVFLQVLHDKEQDKQNKKMGRGGGGAEELGCKGNGVEGDEGGMLSGTLPGVGAMLHGEWFWDNTITANVMYLCYIDAAEGANLTCILPNRQKKKYLTSQVLKLISSSMQHHYGPTSPEVVFIRDHREWAIRNSEEAAMEKPPIRNIQSSKLLPVQGASCVVPDIQDFSEDCMEPGILKLVTCTITGFLMVKPVMTRHGGSYDGHAMQKWNRERGTDPNTNMILVERAKTRQPTLIRNVNLEHVLLRLQSRTTGTGQKFGLMIQYNDPLPEDNLEEKSSDEDMYVAPLQLFHPRTLQEAEGEAAKKKAEEEGKEVRRERGSTQPTCIK